MELFESLLAIVAVLITWMLYQKYRLFSKMAPGPYGIPIFGSMFHLLKHEALDEFQKYKKKYGKVFSFSAGDFYVTVVTDYKLIIENLKKDDFHPRPKFEIWEVRNNGNRNRGILFSDAPVASEQRRFVLRNLRDFGFGKESMEGMLIQELNDLKNDLRKKMANPINLSGVFNASVLNSLWYCMTGKRFELDDPKLQRLMTLMIENVQGIKLTVPTLFFFTPVKLGLIGRKQVKTFRGFQQEIKKFLEDEIASHFDNFKDGQINDFMDAYIQQIKDTKSETSSFYGDEGRANLFSVLLDLFLAGAETTSTTLQWAALYLCHNPQVQKKAQEEIDRVIGRSRPPSRDDKPKLVYLEALLNEVHRLGSLVPVSVFHRSLQDNQIGGHFVPKDSIVFFSIYDAHHDEEVWGDVDNFRPERFLDESETKVVKHEALIPFSSGKRQCLGETLARDTLFIFLAGLLQSFTFELDPQYRGMDLKGSSSFVCSPKPFKVIIKERN